FCLLSFCLSRCFFVSFCLLRFCLFVSFRLLSLCLSRCFFVRFCLLSLCLSCRFFISFCLLGFCLSCCFFVSFCLFCFSFCLCSSFRVSFTNFYVFFRCFLNRICYLFSVTIFNLQHLTDCDQICFKTICLFQALNSYT